MPEMGFTSNRARVKPSSSKCHTGDGFDTLEDPRSTSDASDTTQAAIHTVVAAAVVPPCRHGGAPNDGMIIAAGQAENVLPPMTDFGCPV